MDIKTRVYLDMCCFNRPYDDQSQLRISLETQAKIKIQEMIKDGELDLVTSYTLQYENSQNREAMRRRSIERFVVKFRKEHLGLDRDVEISEKAKQIMTMGIKEKDAYHVGSAIAGGCKYFITTDDRILRHKSDEIIMVNPTEFIRLEVNGNDE